MMSFVELEVSIEELWVDKLVDRRSERGGCL